MAASIWEHFLPDPRVDRTELQKLQGILVIVLGNLDPHPAADRSLVNLVRYAQGH
ncbi:MAG: hypothetical protein JW955_12355 [Sedimentisphaerales bacterium]|nr:hypothetical protein [Sedimentisphaerales bacterium]